MPPLALLLSLLLTSAAPAAPCEVGLCSCIASTPGDMVRRADAVFRGTVVAAEEERVRDETGFAFPMRRVTLRVTGAWKGVSHDTVVVATGMGGGDCGVSFSTGAEYLVYADADEEGLVTGICMRTRPLADAAEDLRALGPPPPR